MTVNDCLLRFRLPEWTHSVYPGGDMKWIADRSFQTNTYTPQLARLKAGFLLREILNRFTDKSQDRLKPNRSLWIYSAHDTTVANILNTLGLFEVNQDNGISYFVSIVIFVVLLSVAQPTIHCVSHI